MAGQPAIPIAVVGISCRLPGGANDPEKLWSMIAEGRSAWSDVPPGRFNWKSFYHPNPDINGTTNHRGGHFLDQDIAAFDASFFGISASEAHAMDPQQRLQLEAAYEAFEDAGIPLENIRGSNTAVYIAMFSRDYDRIMFKDTDDLAKYHLTGVGEAILSNRLSYIFDLKGPSMTIDTGCSGSLVALHQACQSLKSGESNMALVGGTNLFLSPESAISMSLLHVLNDDGRCYTFDSRGNGYGRGEGVAAVVLKRLDDALQAGDNIHAVIRNTGVNQDGRTSGIALPNPDAQQDLICSVYQSVGLNPRDIRYVEAHGTGTIAGDIAESKSIARVFCDNGTRKTSLYIGSIKPNIGHLEASSGIAGLIKAILILKKGYIPPTANLEEFKEDLLFEAWNIKVARSLEPWPETGAQVRRASVNSFGYGGTNAHAILESAPLDIHVCKDYGNPNGHVPTRPHDIENLHPNGYVKEYLVSNSEASENTTTNGFHADHLMHREGTNKRSIIHTFSLPLKKSMGPQLLVISAKSENSLSKMAGNLREWALKRSKGETSLRNLAYTLASRRSIMQWRSSIVASSYEELASLLSPKSIRANKTSADIRLTFIFTGQGAQWVSMGRELLLAHSKFRDSMEQSEEILRSLGAPWSLIEELMLDQSRSQINKSVIAQPAVTAIQIALVSLLDSIGVRPHAVLGHSSGEIAAAYASGALSQAMALKVSYARSRISDICKTFLATKGAMLAVGLGETEVSPYITQLQEGIVSIACVNSPSSVTISGDETAIIELKEILDDKLIFNRRLKVDTAYHSHHMRKIAHEYLRSLDGLKSQKTREAVLLISSVTAARKSSGFDPSYWKDNLVSKVRFSDALESLCRMQSASFRSTTAQPTHVFVELGPHGALSGPVRQTITALNNASFKYSYLPSLVRDRNDEQCMLELIGRLFEFGYPVKFDATRSVGESSRPSTVVHGLPPYAWDHSNTYWHESRLSREYRLRPHPHHDLLGLRIVGSTLYEPTWRNMISIDNLPWLQEHVVDNFVIFPGAGYLCMAIESIRQITQDRQTHRTMRQFKLKDVSFSKALIIRHSPAKVEVQLSLRPLKMENNGHSTGWEHFRVTSSSADGTWSEHCQGFIAIEFVPPIDEVEAMREERLTVESQTAELQSIKKACSQRIDSQSLYQELQSYGNVYGTNFAVIKELHLGKCQALGTVVTPNVADSMPSGFMQPHLIHPTTLDALVHINIPLFHRNCGAGSVMPVSMGWITISADILNTPGDELLVATTLSPAGSNSATADVMVFQTGKNSEMSPVITITKGELRGLGQTQTNPSDLDPERNITYQMKWDIDADFIDSSTFCNREVSSSDDQVLQREKDQLLDQAASLYIDACLGQLAQVTLSVPLQHHIYLFEWMKKYQESEQSQMLIYGKTQPEIQFIFKQAMQAGAAGKLITRVGKNLKALLTGQLELSSLVLEDDPLSQLYADGSSVRLNLQLVRYLKHLSFKNPHMRVLEIGTGIGNIALSQLEGLSQEQGFSIEQYDYTNTSSNSLKQAQSLLQEWTKLVSFRILNIEQNPLEQNFQEHTYDLIIAVNALHQTSHTENTLANIGKLLKPGGKLAFIEPTRVVPTFNVICGLLPGWWKGMGDKSRDSPILSTEEWDSALLRCSFTGTTIGVDDFDGPAHRFTLMVSTYSPQSNNTSLRPIKIMSGATQESQYYNLSQELSSAFKLRGFEVSLSTWPLENVYKDTIYLVLDAGNTPLLLNPSSDQFKQITALMLKGSQVLWLTIPETSSTAIHSMHGMATGLARVARAENEDLKIVTFGVQEKINSDRFALVQAVSDILFHSFGSVSKHKSPGEFEYIYRDKQVLIPRLIPDPKINQLMAATTSTSISEMAAFHQGGRPLKLHVQKPGLLDSLVFVDDRAVQNPIGPDEIEVHVKACGVNFKDVFVALGQLKSSTQMGGEFAGIVTAVGANFQSTFCIGDRVCGFNGTPYASQARIHGSSLCHMPSSMTFREGSSITAVFSTAVLGLIDVANMQKGQTILIHAAAGGVGQAAIMVAQHLGVEVFATVGTAAKRQLLIEKYNVPESHIFSSRLRTFKSGIMRLTNGKGVDVVLNSLAGEALQDSWDCVASFGVFVEIGKADIYRKSHLNMEHFDRNVTFAAIDLVLMANERPGKVAKLLANVMSLFEKGAVAPVQPISTMPITRVEEAFRLIQAGKHIGKVVLECEDETIVKVAYAPPPPLKLDRGGSYVIAGGLGDLGQKIIKYIAAHGAKHIVLLTRKVFNPTERQGMEVNLSQDSGGAKIYIMSCDINDQQNVERTFSHCKETLPPVKGVIQAAMVLEDGILEKMTADAFKLVVGPKLQGTRHLIEGLCGCSLDFFVMLSSCASVLAPPSQANYAAGNACLDTLANRPNQARTSYVSVNLPIVEDSEVISGHQERLRSLIRRGCIQTKMDPLLSILGYAMSTQARQDNINQIVIGFDRLSISTESGLAEFLFKNSLFTHLPYYTEKTNTQLGSQGSKSIDELLAATNDEKEVHDVIANIIAKKICALVSFGDDEIDFESPMGEFGMDSLVAIEMKNWLARTFQAATQVSEILDAPNIATLAGTVAKRSSLVKNVRQPSTQANGQNTIIQPSHQELALPEDKVTSLPKLPSLPLPDLESTLQLYQTSVRAFCSDQEYAKVSEAVQEFSKPEGLGQELQSRLSERANDPAIDNWQFDLYNDHVYLKCREPVNPFQHFFGCHSASDFQHGQAERAALVSYAVFQFKLLLDEDKIKPDYLNEQALCMSSLKWLFNAYREPCARVDKVKQFPGNDYMMVLRRGHIFQVLLKERNEVVQYAVLKAAFEQILDKSHQRVPSVATLTADSRDSWAEIRELVKADSQTNGGLLDVIEAAAFIICLDDGSPDNPTDRVNQYLFGDPSNRWSDKALQFIICENGDTAFVCEHAMVDGGSLQQLNEFVSKAILAYTPDAPRTGVTSTTTHGHFTRIVEHTFTVTPTSEEHINRVQKQFHVSGFTLESGHFESKHIGSTFLRSHKCPPKTGYQLIIQLASLSYFGYQTPSWETVSMRPFQKGRVDIIQAVLPPVAEFCAAMYNDDTATSTRRKLFREAAKAHNSTLTRVSRGRGFAGHLYALQEVLREGEELPPLFTDPTYQKTRPAKLMTDCTEWISPLQEGGFLMPDPEHMWVHYEVRHDGCLFGIKGPKGQTTVFFEALERAALMVKALLEEE